MAESLTNMPRHSLYIIIGALCVAFVLMLIILIVGICRISRIEYQGSSRPAYEEFYNCRSIDSEFSSAIASIRHARFGKKSRPAMYDATPITYEDYSPDDKPLVTLIKTKDLMILGINDIEDGSGKESISLYGPSAPEINSPRDLKRRTFGKDGQSSSPSADKLQDPTIHEDPSLRKP
uniref:Uncharacterized protein n=1 Tax=Sphaerodactylus townsendi TaxID=933632 RepID=A0ACB8FAS7_9SAUR